MSDSHDADLLNIFWTEVGDYLQTLSSGLLQIEASTAGNKTESLREMNRVAHSMKGAARAVGISVIETISHYMEEVFEAAVKGEMELTPTTCDLLYDGLDLIQNVVNGVENSTEILATTLTRLEQTVTAVAKPAPSLPKVEPKPPPIKSTTATRIMPVSPDALDSGTLQLRSAEESVRVPVSRLDRLMGEVSELLINRMHGEQNLLELHRLQKHNRRWQREWRAVRTAYIRMARRMQNQPDDVPDEVTTLFKFLEMNQRYLQDASREFAQLSRAMTQYNAQLTLLSEQLQDEVGGMRLVPFETLVAGFQRVVRDLSRDMNKEVHLEIVGAHVEMDKTALDVLKDPIMHLLRNAVDHGLEKAEERKHRGKSPSGRLELSVEQHGKEILLRISDDGRGLNADKIGRAAVEGGLLTAQEAAGMDPHDLYNLIFHPGLSTSDQITAISGRGMGMDIVRTRAESLRGRVSIESTPGAGTTFLLRIPVSLTRLSCILLRTGGQEFAVPSASVTRMFTMRRDELFSAEGRDMVMVNGQPLPVVPLDTLLGIPSVSQKDDAKSELTLLALTVGDRGVAFEVDSLYNERELILKPLGQEIAGAPYISGAALLGTGDIIIILDPNDLLRGATGTQHVRLRPVSKQVTPVNVPARVVRVLIADDSITTRTLEKHILETAGFEVYVAVDGLEAWNKLEELEVDVVIADVEMPNMTGLELARHIKDGSHTKHLPVVLLTSLGKPEQREAGLRAGADAYLVKSKFDQSELLEILRSIV